MVKFQSLCEAKMRCLRVLHTIFFLLAEPSTLGPWTEERVVTSISERRTFSLRDAK